MIWESFAKRGLGFSASQGSTGSRFDGTEAYDIPPACEFRIDMLKSICGEFSVDYNIVVGDLFQPNNSNPVSLSLSGNPAGSNVSFSTNPINPPGTSTMTISGSGVATGEYIMTLSATNGDTTRYLYPKLIVVNDAPTPPVLLSPLNFDNFYFTPLLSWEAQPLIIDYEVKVSINPDLSSPFINTTTTTNTFEFAQTLSPGTYYWGIKANNICGSDSSVIWSFNMLPLGSDCVDFNSSDIPKAIASVGRDTVYSTIQIMDPGVITNVIVSNVSITHTWIGDIELDLQSPSGTIVQLLWDPCDGNVQYQNLNLGFDDAAAPGVIPCPPTSGFLYIPRQPLATFAGENQAGTWTLIVRDDFTGDGGSLTGWSLEICTLSDHYCYADVDGDGYGSPLDSILTSEEFCGMGYVLNNLDCDDSNPTFNPNNECPEYVPTMGTWGLIILFFASLILGTIFVQQRGSENRLSVKSIFNQHVRKE